MQQQQQTRNTPQPATPVVEEMPVVEPADLAATDELLDSIDEMIAESTEAADLAILSAVANEPVRKVHAGTARSARAWTSSGGVD